jgi:hypothetical protein
MSNTHLTKNRSEKLKTQYGVVKKFTGHRLLTPDILTILSDTGERLFGRYLPFNEEETIGAVARGTG